jgi:hypothetical protein
VRLFCCTSRNQRRLDTDLHTIKLRQAKSSATEEIPRFRSRADILELIVGLLYSSWTTFFCVVLHRGRYLVSLRASFLGFFPKWMARAAAIV